VSQKTGKGKTMKRKFKIGWMLWAIALLPAGTLRAQEGLVLAPKSDAALREAMKITYNQHILPEGARPEMLQNLMDRGQVIVFYDHPPVVPWMSAAGITVNAPPELVFATVSDFDHYNTFVPMTEAAQAKKAGDNLYQVDYKINVKMAFIKYTQDYGVYHYHRPPDRTDWCHAWGDFNINVGFWELIPTSDGRTMAFYSVYSEPRSKFLQLIFKRVPLVETMINVSTAVMVTRAAKHEAEKRYQAAGGKVLPAKKARPVFELLTEDSQSLRKFLDRGKLLVLEDGPTVYVTAGALVPAAAEQAWSVIADFPKYPEFMPGVKKVETLGANAQGPRYHWEIAMDLALFDYSYNYDADYVMHKPEYMTWVMHQEGSQPAPGFWKLIENENKTLIFLGTTADLRQMGMILSYAIKTEPTLEHALLGCQALVTLNNLKDRIGKVCAGPKGK